MTQRKTSVIQSVACAWINNCLMCMTWWASNSPQRLSWFSGSRFFSPCTLLQITHVCPSYLSGQSQQTWPSQQQRLHWPQATLLNCPKPPALTAIASHIAVVQSFNNTSQGHGHISPISLPHMHKTVCIRLSFSTPTLTAWVGSQVMGFKIH